MCKTSKPEKSIFNVKESRDYLRRLCDSYFQIKMNSIIIVRPEIPHYRLVPSNFCSGSNITLNAIVPATGASRFILSLQFIGDTQTDVPLEITIDLSTNILSLNSSLNGTWNEAKTFSNVPVTSEEPFTLIITCISNGYEILINNTQFNYFRQENAYNNVNHFAVCGDIQVQQITITTGATQNTSRNIDINNDAPPPSYNAAVANASNSLTIQPILGYPPPLPPTFVPGQVQNQSQLIQIPTSSNFHPVKPTKTWICYPYHWYIGLIVFIILAKLFGLF